MSAQGFTDNAKKYTVDTRSVSASRKAFKAGNIDLPTHVRNLLGAKTLAK
tara:strand:- start:197 stop:346 length:150 start_codon:yes stop_codon:yes gene_type:complete